MLLGQPIPTLTASYVGFTNGETATVLSSPPVITTSVTSGSPSAPVPSFSLVTGLITCQVICEELTRRFKREFMPSGRDCELRFR